MRMPKLIAHYAAVRRNFGCPKLIPKLTLSTELKYLRRW